MKITLRKIQERKINPEEIKIGDWIEGTGTILTQLELAFVRKMIELYTSKKEYIFIKTKKPELTPERQYPDDAGFDLKCAIDSIIIDPHQSALIPTGVYMAIPYGYEGQIRPRSGHAVKHGLIVGADTIDAGYRGEIQVHLLNTTKFPVTIKYGERIAQIVISPVFTGELIQAPSLPTSERGSGGFGSTGV